ncbi:MAG: M55 family metallopeptidase [Phycisphaerae bacterium]|nr:M55 family metallopeptidase [Phycisphaerae bacterium]
MRVYIATDMEGMSLIWKPEQVSSDQGAEYEYGRRQSSDDVNAAVTACFDAGATRVVVQDGHGPSALLWDQIDPRAEIERVSHAGCLQPSLDESFDALLEVGRHAMAGTPMAFLEHTQSSRAWFCYKLNGAPYGEIAQEAFYAGSFGVPLVFVSGDRAACREAEEQFPGVVTAEVKWAVKRNAAHCLSGEVARRRITEWVKQALALAREKKIKPVFLSAPITVELTFQRVDLADAYMGRRGVERVDGRTIRFIADNQRDILRF